VKRGDPGKPGNLVGPRSGCVDDNVRGDVELRRLHLPAGAVAADRPYFLPGQHARAMAACRLQVPLQQRVDVHVHGKAVV